MNTLPIRIALVFLLTLLGCDVKSSMRVGSTNDDSLRSTPLPEGGTLSQDLVVFIGRGGCCYGHIISIDRSGRLRYLVGTYHRSESGSDESSEILPEIFDSKAIEMDTKYAERNRTVSVEKLKELERLLRDGDQIGFQDNTLVEDDYLYQVYFDRKRIAYGYGSHLKSFPLGLQELITILNDQVELHKLPGMA